MAGIENGRSLKNFTKDLITKAAPPLIFVDKHFPRAVDKILKTVPRFIINRRLEAQSETEWRQSIFNVISAFEIIKRSGLCPTEKTAEQLAQASVFNYVRQTLEILTALYSKDPLESLPIFEASEQIPEDVQQFFNGPKGLLVSWHSGNYLAPIVDLTKRLAGKRLGVFMEDSLPESVRIKLTDLLCQNGVVPLEHQRNGLLGSIRVIRNETDFVVTAIDRLPPGGSARKVIFFGQKALFPNHIAWLSRYTQRPILPIGVVKKDNGAYTYAFGEVIPPRKVEKPDEEQADLEVTQEILTAAEGIIGRYPEYYYPFDAWWESQKL